MTQCSDIETTIKDFKTEVDYAIWRAVCGRPSPWLIDRKFKPKPGATFAERFMAGDDQMLLWEINCCAQKRQAIPKWAADALYERLFCMAKGGVDSWDDVFGKPYADDKQRGDPAPRPQEIGTRIIRICNPQNLKQRLNGLERKSETGGKNRAVHPGHAFQNAACCSKALSAEENPGDHDRQKRQDRT